jgi:DNA-binding XRE family transcriptional regulator
MNSEKRKALEADGWVFGDAEDFLELTIEERRLVELRVAVSRALRAFRKNQKMTQVDVAKKLNTSQSRFAQIEAGASGVSLDLMFRGLFALGGTVKDLQNDQSWYSESGLAPIRVKRRSKPRLRTKRK